MPIRMDEDDWEDDNWDSEDDWDSDDNWDNTEIDTTDPSVWEDDFDETEEDLEPEPEWDNDDQWDDKKTDWEDETITDWDDESETQELDDNDIMDSYAVAKGDTLWKIAEDFYGDGSKYHRIFAANTDILKNPNLIIPGTVLKIPYDE